MQFLSGVFFVGQHRLHYRWLPFYGILLLIFIQKKYMNYHRADLWSNISREKANHSFVLNILMALSLEIMKTMFNARMFRD